MPHVNDCQSYPVCQFTSDYCDKCMEVPSMQTTGTMPQLASNTNYGKQGSAKTTKGGKGKKC